MASIIIIFRPMVRYKTLPDSRTSGSWSNLLSRGTTRVLRALQYFELWSARYMYWEYSQYLEVLYCGYCLYSQVFRVSILRVHTCLCSRGSVWYCSYSHYSEYLGLLSTRNILAASTPILSVLGLRFVLEHLSMKPSYVTLSTNKKKNRRDICCMCCILLRRL